MATITWCHCIPDGLDKVIWKSNFLFASTAGVEFRGRGNHGQTLRVILHADSFEDLAQAMMKADHDEALKAFGTALTAGIPSEKPAQASMCYPEESEPPY